jgi:ribonuclease HII
MESKIRLKPLVNPLKYHFCESNAFEIGIDEAGRGPLFGRVYVGAVVLPKDDPSFNYLWLRDSKKIKNRKTMRTIAEHIKKHALYWHVSYAESDEIDQVNILKATMNHMHNCIKYIGNQMPAESLKEGLCLVDGNYFKPCIWFDEELDGYKTIPHITVENGDAVFASIAAASILAKHARDTYIEELCAEYPLLQERYKLLNNMGYGTAAHIEGIQNHGITQWHRQSFNICHGATMNSL